MSVDIESIEEAHHVAAVRDPPLSEAAAELRRACGRCEPRELAAQGLDLGSAVEPEDAAEVCEAEDGDEAIRLLPASGARVVLLDVRLPRRSGIEVLQELRRTGREVPTILLATFDDDAVVLDGIRAGAGGFLLKTVSFEQLVQAIRTVAAGMTLFLPGITDRVLRGLQASGEAAVAGRAGPDPLTQREAEILRLVAGGYSNREIAGALGSAEGTVKNHLLLQQVTVHGYWTYGG